jgi:UDP-glucuronate decarboxylase
MSGTNIERVVVTGSGGWIGSATIELAQQMESAPEIVALAQHPRVLRVGEQAVDALSVDALQSLPAKPATCLIHCGFPTQDRVESMGASSYTNAVMDLRQTMVTAIRKLCPDAFVYLSSGAATSVERGVDVAQRTQVYGQAKLDDEAAYAEAMARTGGRLCIVRAFALSGPYMTKPEAYALGSMIMQAEATGRIEVRATRPVRRSYMAIDDMLRIAMHAVGELESGDSTTFETAGEAVEMGELAARVLGVLGADPSAVRRPEFKPDAPPNDYLGDAREMERLANAAGVVLADLDRQIAVTADWLRVEGIA